MVGPDGIRIWTFNMLLVNRSEGGPAPTSCDARAS
jgi:hypothetical protein